MSRPIVSVIVPAFNAERTLAATIESVTQQTLPELEVVIVDDGSRDGTARIAEAAAAADARIRVISQPNAGVGAARKTGLDAARGRLIHFLDADDMLQPDALEHLVPVADKHGAAVATVRVCDTTGRPLDIDIPAPAVPLTLDDLLDDNVLPLSGTMLARGLASMEPPRAIPAGEDYDMWLRLASSGVTWRGVPDAVVHYRLMPQSNSKRARLWLDWSVKAVRSGVQAARQDPRLDASERRERRTIRRLALRYATLQALIAPTTQHDEPADMMRAHDAAGGITGEVLGAASFEAALHACCDWPDPLMHPPEVGAWSATGSWTAALASWWHRLQQEGWCTAEVLEAATRSFADRLVRPSEIVDALLAGAGHEVVIIGHGTNGRRLEHAAGRRRVMVRDDRYGEATGPANHQPMAAPLPTGATAVITPDADETLTARFPRARRWSDARASIARAKFDALASVMLRQIAA